MAIAAIRFILGMTLDQRTRHDQPVEPALRLGGRGKHTCQYGGSYRVND
jgi:hypothetical protein